MKKKMLVIPGGFVPYNDPVTLLSYKHLRLLDLDMDVVALKGKEDTTIFNELNNDSNYSKFKIEYICDYDDAVATFERKNVISGVYNSIRYILKAINKFKSYKYDFVYTSSIPCFTHVAGYFIKKRNPNVKWIASFSDPLKKSPYKYDKESFKEYSLIAKIGFLVYIFIYMNGLYESIAMKYADKIIYICEEQEEFMIRNHKYPNLKDKSMIIPLNYIPEWKMYSELITVKNVQKPQTAKLTMGHFGRIYGLRLVDKFIDALNEVNNELNGELANKLVIYQYGQFLDRYINQIKKYKLEDLFVFSEKIPYSDAVEKMKQVDILALFDTILDDDQPQPYLPSKFLEYVLLQKPIFTIACKNSPMARFSRELNVLYSDNQVNAIKRNIYKVLNVEFDSKKNNYQQFENSLCVKPLIEYINEQ